MEPYIEHNSGDYVEDDKKRIDEAFHLRNPHMHYMGRDILYHLDLDTDTHDLAAMFGDVKFVCIGGTAKRMEEFATYIMGEIGLKLPVGTCLLDISRYSHRYAMFKVGPVLAVSHGMGIPSVSILLHELFKLMYHARVKDPIFIRLGTCGGIAMEGGTVVVSEYVVDGMQRSFLEIPILGELVQRPAKLCRKFAWQLKSLADDEFPFKTVVGKTMCTYDFYEGQARLDGAFCGYKLAEKLEFLEILHKTGVVNIEMESLAFAALTHYAGVKAAVVCVCLMDRLKEDQVFVPKDIFDEWQMRPTKLVASYIKKCLSNQ